MSSDQPETATGVAEVDPTVGRKSKLDALKKKAEASREKSLIDAFNKVELFDSTKASGWKTTGTHTLEAMKTGANPTRS